MNLRVDLILDTEQRSGTVFNAKAVVRMSSAIAPLLLVMLAFYTFLGMRKVTGELSMLEAEWNAAKPRKIRAEEIAAQREVNGAIRSEIEGWKTSRMAWSEQLLGLMRRVPSSIQMHRLRTTQALHLIDEKLPARVFAMTLEGKAVGGLAEDNVQAMRRQLAEGPPFEESVSEVKVAKFAQDPSGDAVKTDRIFTIELTYEPRAFE